LEETAMSATETYSVTGMTCGHCVSAVTEELTRLPGVAGVHVALKPGEASVVTISVDAPLDPAAVREAVDEAGYQVTP
jgi:copper chaperone CopZ